jgi:hypothetical protein
MNTEWIKKNWMTIGIVALVIILVIYFVRKNRETLTVKFPKATKLFTIARGKAPEQETKTKAQLQAELDACEKAQATVRLMPGAVSPCARIRELLNKTESNFNGFAGPFTSTNGINVTDYAMGMEGLSLLEDKSLSSYNGIDVFKKTDGLNVMDFAIGLDGTSLLMDKNL